MADLGFLKHHSVLLLFFSSSNAVSFNSLFHYVFFFFFYEYSVLRATSAPSSVYCIYGDGDGDDLLCSI